MCRVKKCYYYYQSIKLNNSNKMKNVKDENHKFLIHEVFKKRKIEHRYCSSLHTKIR